MKLFKSKVLSFVLALVLVANVAVVSEVAGNDSGISTCDEDPLDFAFNDD